MAQQQRLAADIQKAQQFFINSSSTIPMIGCELEFYLFQGTNAIAATPSQTQNFIKLLNESILNDQNLSLLIEKEQGASQIEIKTSFTQDLTSLCQKINLIRIKTQKLALSLNLNASFESLPLANDCPNSLQFNITLHDKIGRNILDNDNIIHKFCQNLLDITPNLLKYLAPTPQDLKRFNLQTNINLFKSGKYTAPVNLSYGPNNRSCAIRIAPGNFNKEKRIEYRLASASSDPFIIISNLLQQSANFYSQKIIENDPRFIYGNAFDKKYKMPLISNAIVF